MPTYEYTCSDCGEQFDVFASISEKERGLSPLCPRCGSSNTSQVLGGFAFLGAGSPLPFGCSPGQDFGPGCC